MVPGIGFPGPMQSQLSLDAPPPGVLSLFVSFASHGRSVMLSLPTDDSVMACSCLQGPIPEQIEVDPHRDFCAGRGPLVLQVDGVRLHTFSL